MSLPVFCSASSSFAADIFGFFSRFFPHPHSCFVRRSFCWRLYWVLSPEWVFVRYCWVWRAIIRMAIILTFRRRPFAVFRSLLRRLPAVLFPEAVLSRFGRPCGVQNYFLDTFTAIGSTPAAGRRYCGWAGNSLEPALSAFYSKPCVYSHCHTFLVHLSFAVVRKNDCLMVSAVFPASLPAVC
jgi:hypothetical protein